MGRRKRKGLFKKIGRFVKRNVGSIKDDLRNTDLGKIAKTAINFGTSFIPGASIVKGVLNSPLVKKAKALLGDGKLGKMIAAVKRDGGIVNQGKIAKNIAQMTGKIASPLEVDQVTKALNQAMSDLNDVDIPDPSEISDDNGIMTRLKMWFNALDMWKKVLIVATPLLIWALIKLIQKLMGGGSYSNF